MFLNRLNARITPEAIPESQCEFSSERSTIDIVFCLRQMQEKRIEQTVLEVAFSDIHTGRRLHPNKERSRLVV